MYSLQSTAMQVCHQEMGSDSVGKRKTKVKRMAKFTETEGKDVYEVVFPLGGIGPSTLETSLGMKYG
ncbi:hypothetical protein PISMIDRAFT_680649 [Pisolithus microcarpus 441]|uniref:Uncharacterized protein n=1 Tax=Pisolithus microcarpus 441 TaxID=765257 RepID=A0A0C9Z7X0_9AGAM|nr:hypothetical protein PISMIDRAFT_680649 [Pisolithus microcarpus 441]